MKLVLPDRISERCRIMNTVIIILLVVLAIAVVLLFAICGFLFNQVIWYKPIKLPAAKG